MISQMDATMKANLNGAWHGAFPSSTTPEPHRLTLGLSFSDSPQPTASLVLHRSAPDPKTNRTVIQFQVHVELNDDGAFLALLAKDASGADMFITMVLKMEEEDTALRGLLVFNNVRFNKVDQGPIEFRRPDSAS